METEDVFTYSQALPEGVDRLDIAELMHHVSDSVAQKIKQGACIEDVLLVDTDEASDVPSFSVFFSLPELEMLPSVKHRFPTKVAKFTRVGESTSGSIAALLREAADYIEKGKVEVEALVFHAHVGASEHLVAVYGTAESDS